MRTVTLALLALAIAGCGTKRCKDGTLLVTVQLSGGAEAADQLDVVVTIDGTPVPSIIAHKAGDASGGLEVDFPSGFPAGRSVTIAITALGAGATLGTGQASVTPTAGCDVATVQVAPGGGDGGMGDMVVPCPSGQQDNDGDGMCQPDCAHSGLSCGQPHTVCSDATGTAACVCVTGYKLVGTTCTWQEVPLDPTFENKPPGSWSLSGGATIDPLAAGLGEVGTLVLNKNSLCSSGGKAQQTIAMPSFASAEPFALNVTTQADCQGGLGCSFTAGVRINGGVVVIPYSNILKNVKPCLGDRGYGGMVDIAAAGGDRNSCVTSTGMNLVFDHLGIVPDATCPAPGAFPNGNFEAATDWVATASGGTANIVAGAGQAATAGGHLATTAGCQFPSLIDRISIPWKTSNAIQFAWKGTLNFQMQIGDGNTSGPNPNWAEMTGDGGSFQTYSMCVPEYAKGMVQPFRVSTFSTALSCPTAQVRDFVVDNFMFVNNAACPATASIIDGGFEMTTARLSYWPISINTNGTVGMVSGTIVNDSLQAHSGNRALVLTTSQACTSPTAQTVITVPPSMGTSGPAVVFFAMANANAIANVSFSTTPGGVVSMTGSYAKKVVCLDPSMVGQGVNFSVTTIGNSGTCANTYPSSTGWFDDFVVTTDPSCPAN